MHLRWLDPAHLDPRDVAGLVAAVDAAREVDTPHRPPGTVSAFVSEIQHGWDGDPSAFAVTDDGTGRVVGVLEVDLPRWDNTHAGFVNVVVDPAHRRRGLGSRMFEAGVEQVRAAGRTVVLASSLDDTCGVAFGKAMGLERATDEVERRQDLLTLDRPALSALRTDAEQHAGAYELVRMPAWTPDDQLAEVAQLTAAINDAPTDDLDIEDEVYTPTRIRAFERAQLAHGRRMYRLVARERAAGDLAGQTVVAVDAEQPGTGWQYDTSVLADHRGHRLGVLLKLSMLDWLAEEEPQVRSLGTWNAASNDHMVGVNVALGYQVMASWVGWQRRLSV